jgi:UDP-glucuronate 4-epimerase
VRSVTGKELQIEQLSKQPGDVDITNADISKAKNLLDYDPATSFHQGMKKLYDWYVSNRLISQ